MLGTFALPPDVLAQQHPAEFLESCGWVVERPEHRLALRNGQREHLDLPPIGVLQLAGEAGVVDQACELGYEHTFDRTRSRPVWLVAVSSAFRSDGAA